MTRYCEYCKDKIKTKAKKFCSKSCACIARNKSSNIIDKFKKKYGENWEMHRAAWIQKISLRTKGENNPMYGRHDHVHGLKRYASEKQGKSLEEIHGEAMASKLRNNLSEKFSGENNPAYGKSYVNGGKSIKGHYKGIFFRSLLEYSFLKHLEVEKIDIHSDVDYECFQAHFEFEGKRRTYRPDFYVKSRNVVYEVKPSYVLKSVPELQLAKWNAMRELLEPQGIDFRVMTETDFYKVEFDVARLDPDVVWKEDTFKYFKKASPK